MEKRKTITRRDFLRLGSVATGAGLLAACAPQVIETTREVEVTRESEVTRQVEVTRLAEPTATAAPQAGLVRGGQLIAATLFSVDTLDPHRSLSAHAPYSSLCHNYLINHRLVDAATGKSELVGDLAETFEYQDSQTAILTLKTGIKFHDGSDFNATVAKWNLDRMVQHPNSVMRSVLNAIESVEAPDDTTIIIHMSRPFTILFENLSGGQLLGRPAMVSMQAAEELGDDAFGQTMVGTGPFKFKERIGDDRVVVERFEDYWETGEDGNALPYLDEVVSRIIPDLTVATAELAAGTVDMVQELPPSQYKAVSALATLAADVWSWAGLSVITGHINNIREPFTDIRVRQALNFGIDREALAMAAGFGLGVPASTNNAAGESTEGWTEEIEHMYDFDPEKAKALLVEAGFPDGITTTMKSIFREPDNTASQFVTQTWKQSNINVESVLQERTAWIEDIATNRDFDLAFSRYPLAGISPIFFRTNWASDGANNYEGVADPLVDDLITQGEGEIDPAKRAEIAHDLLLHVQEQAYHFNGFRMPQVLARQAKIQGIVPNWAAPNVKGAWRSEV